MTALLDRQADIGAAAARTVDFLLARQDPGGSWRDFLLPAGLSDSWVTAYTAEALLGDGEDTAPRAAAERAWRFLREHSLPEGGWSYNPGVPGDADSSLWALRLADGLAQAESPTARRGFAFLARHVRPDGGLATYADPAAIRGYVGLPAFISFDGWTQSHACVSAAGAHLAPHADTLAPYLLDRQADDGSWPAYFWFDREYATSEAVRALAKLDATAHRPAIERATGWLIRRTSLLAAAQGAIRPAFALACATHALAEASDQADARRAARAGAAALAVWQRDTGGWGPTARLRVPPPHAIDPPEDVRWTRWQGMPADAPASLEGLAATFTNFSPDHRGIFGAATALRALRAVTKGAAA
ncbi:squalene--hopene cyclase [Sphingomonas sp. ABOLE]|uniref:prenyltransferase/squalene oxidase repeat-containing protein n=1 Tax=Sphingomonas sp. ABOLE TaxID=1985878 RepID=UPI000F7E30ED|nr:prenyltransferase/squalene oxidase repeat-containing protein [Sphingomonas sp. ABOLE]RSV38792.1 squalene--hopene cyclase [Sphingomonas sp. ABOLE]